MLAEFRSGVGVDELDVYRCVRSSFDLLWGQRLRRDRAVGRERHSRVELGGVGNGYSIVTRYDMIRRVTGRPELFMRPSA